jgi:hypothetical protein
MWLILWKGTASERFPASETPARELPGPYLRACAAVLTFNQHEEN